MKSRILLTSILLCTPLITNAEIFENIRKEMNDLRQSLMTELRHSQAEEKQIMESGYNEKEKKYFFKIQLPGFNEKDIEIKVKADKEEKFIIVTAEKKVVQKNITKESKQESIEEKKFQTLRSLPKDADITKIEWNYKDGILTLQIPTTNKTENFIVIKNKTS